MVLPWHFYTLVAINVTVDGGEGEGKVSSEHLRPDPRARALGHFVLRKYRNFLGAQVGALFCNFECSVVTTQVVKWVGRVPIAQSVPKYRYGIKFPLPCPPLYDEWIIRLFKIKNWATFSSILLKN